MFVSLLETANSMFLSFIRFELLSFERGNPIAHKMWNGSFVRVQSGSSRAFYVVLEKGAWRWEKGMTLEKMDMVRRHAKTG